MTTIISLVLLTLPQPYGFETWFEQDPAPVPIVAQSIGNPLDYAGARIGLDVRNVELPRGWEDGYRYCCRAPLIDYVSTRPLFMKQWAEGVSKGLSYEHRRFGILAAGCGRSELCWPWYVGEGVGWSPNEPDSAPLPGVKETLVSRGFTPRYALEVARLCGAMAKAWTATRAAQAALSPSDREFLARNPGYYLAPDGKRMPELTGDRTQQDSFIRLARRVDLNDIFDAAEVVGRAVSHYYAKTGGWEQTDVFRDHSRPGTTSFEAPFGTVIIAGSGNDNHEQNAALLIDLGGDDVYRNSAGGCGRSGGVAVCIDLSGNDRYEVPDSSYVQGFGFLGVGILADLDGNDVYNAKHFSQGVGILGLGALWDRAGNDTFSAHAFCQGAGAFGFGTLLDYDGSDVYDCATMGQGSATTLGMGILSDLEGDDKYRLAVDTTKDVLGGIPGCGQGGALSFRAYPWDKALTPYGGVGLLVDDKGNDDYVSNGWCSQGGSYIMSLGALVDNEGNDHYVCGTGQGSGIHVTNAILIDKKGDDIYEGGFRSGGSGGDRSPGFLIDYEGNDIYKSATSSYGTGCKPFSYSLFIDYKGDDQYICDRPKGDVLFNDWHSFGGVWPESDPNLWPYAICLDLGGKDKYDVRNRANNSETHSFGHGIHLDMEWKGGDVIGRVEPRRGLSSVLPRGTDSRGWFDDFFAYNCDPFERFGGVGRVVDSGTSMLPELLQLAMAGPWSAERDVLECLHRWFASGQIGESKLTEVLTLLDAYDPEVRLTIADDLGLWKMRGAEDALVEAAKTDSSAQVCRFALRSLLRLESVKAIPIARKLATEDTSDDVRRMAVALVGKVRPSGEVLALLRWVLAEDKASSVRCAAADAMGNLGNPDAVEYLREAAKTYDVYVQRACGKALCQLYQVEGIQLLISSLSFPSIDACYNYDRNVPNSISAYAGFDLPDTERYDQAHWQKWFDTHKGAIDIKANADAFRAYTAMTDSVRGEPDSIQLPRYEAFLVRFPNHTRARAELAGMLNGLAWAMVTTTLDRDAKKGLVYAQRAAELSDDPNIWDTLIEAYLANGMKQDALRATEEALRRHSDEPMLKDRLKKLKE